MAINEAQDYLVSSSTDGTVRVWTFVYDLAVEERKALPPKERDCPLRCMHVLRHESGWVHDVVIQGTTIISGGGDYAFRVWDARTGEQLYNLTGLYRRHSLGVQALAVQGSFIATGSPLDRYYVWQAATASDGPTAGGLIGPCKLLHVLDEALPSWEHHQFEHVESQYYRTRVLITPTVYITNSKRTGMLCIWSRATGRMLHRIWVAGVVAGEHPRIEAQVSKQDHHIPPPSPPHHYHDSTTSANVVRENGNAHVATRSQDKIEDAAKEITGGITGNVFIDSEAPHPLYNPKEDSIEGGEHADHSPADEVMSDRIHDFVTDVTGEFLMVTMTTGRMVLFRFGASPTDRPVRLLRPRMSHTTKNESVDEAAAAAGGGWILSTNAQGELVVDRA
ncbi:hypothetical protein DFQ27_000248 [Actinomortierella ambigua]|uniref:Uncharacterized protein n=1 Tax=Actinomortierella ambigua TaxID=1343610 RepID=A0A9P6QEA1_9FUNG|nr:hypothetical protein DFQ27_000248 [Actinomortierella ambigua]